MNCCNKSFTPYWQKAAIIKQQLKIKARGWQREERAFLKKTGGIPTDPPADRTFSLLIMRITKVSEKIILECQDQYCYIGGMYGYLKLSVVN